MAGQLRRYPWLAGGLERLWAWVGGVNIRTKILGMVLTLTIVLGLGVTWQVRAMMSKTLLDGLRERSIGC